MKTDKDWGTTECLLITNNTEIHRLEINKHGKSSYHHHKSKFNAIRVESGKLQIIHEIGVVTLQPQQQIIFSPGEKHQFIAIEDTVAYEFYWVTIDTEDIVRECE